MKLCKKVFVALSFMSASMSLVAQSDEVFTPYRQSDLRLPSVPLLTNDPYFSIWSNYDALNAGPTRHWSEQEKAMEGLLRVDGTAYRFMGIGMQNLLSPLAPMAIDDEGWSGRVSHRFQTTEYWVQPNFDDSTWPVEKAAWGTVGEYPNVNNEWKAENSDIYVRRSVTLTADDLKKELWLQYSHDDVFELYINGTRVIDTGETWVQGVQHQLEAAEKALLHEGENVFAAHCHNTAGGAYIDFGLYENVLQSNGQIQTAKQESVDVMATSTYYTFACGPVRLDLVFTAPMLIDDLNLISTPVNYISYRVESTDGREHDIQFYLSTTPQMTVNEMNQPTVSSIITKNDTHYVKSGSTEQKILGRSGDLISIDWGWLYMPATNGQVSVAPATTAENYFVQNGTLQSATGELRSTNRSNMPVLAYMHDFGTTRKDASFTMVGYDEIYDMQYMGNNYKAYYARNGKTIFQAFDELRDQYADIMQRCRDLDKRIYDDALAAGNQKYAEILAGNYRLVMAAHKLFQDDKGNILYFSKENKSNGCVNTVDLTYPSCPLYLTYNPTLQKGMLLSILDYCNSPSWNHDYAAHDIGQYPLANGQVYGEPMPLEEGANMVILAAAISKIEGSTDWLNPYWSMITRWANYLRDNGQDPANQLCTDDFKGRTDRNINLSAKAILGVAAYAEMLKMRNNVRQAATYMEKAHSMALLWEADARAGDHYRLSFGGESGAWSLKYNLLWDKLWGLDLFPAEVYDRELNFYLSRQTRFGLPLDSRGVDSKADWSYWVAAMAPTTDMFLRFSNPIWTYINGTGSRIPLSDWYRTDNGYTMNFSARSVIGGFWAKVFMDKYKAAPAEYTGWAPQGYHIKTRWASQVNPECPLPEFPRPQMQRDTWTNLNGLWDYAIVAGNTTPKDADYGEQKILVPFAIESSLSGVMHPLEPGKTLWYRRDIDIPEEWLADGRRVILNFGAVDYEATVFVNGTSGRYQATKHTGGHSAFSADITTRLKAGTNTLYVKVTDSTNEFGQPVGKQRRYPNGGGDIFYTSVSGIWQTVWLESVGRSFVETLRNTPDVDNSRITLTLGIRNPNTADRVRLTLRDGDKVVGEQTLSAAAEVETEFTLSSPKLWSPAHPNLYNLDVTLIDGEADGGKTDGGDLQSPTILDHIDSYTALRKIGYRRDEQGFWRLQLNNQDLFQFGLLDQGYWPDGLYTAPTDEALRFDIEKTRDWGFNMIRKHMKTEPARWYYHCDRLGLLVWQDMPASYATDENDWTIGNWYRDHNCTQNATLERNFRAEWKEIIDQHYSNPCIVVWTPFNERWGQFKTAEIVAYTQELDPTRLVNPASGGNHYRLGEGTIVDQHTYDQPIRFFINDPSRPLVLGEYGGLGRNISGHRWFDRNSQTYNTYSSSKTLTDAFVTLAHQIHDMSEGQEYNGDKTAYGAAVYTQTTDVETEVNGVMTYDREVVKFDENRLREAVQSLTSLFGSEIYDGIQGVRPSTQRMGETMLYDAQGRRIASPVRGLNIVRNPDGTTRKFIRK